MQSAKHNPPIYQRFALETPAPPNRKLIEQNSSRIRNRKPGLSDLIYVFMGGVKRGLEASSHNVQAAELRAPGVGAMVAN